MNDAAIPPSPTVDGSASPSTASTVLDAFLRWARETPDAVAATCGGASLTYAQVDRMSDLLAADLRARALGRGDYVGLFLERSLEMIVGIIAILKAGAAYVPLDARIAPTVYRQHVIDKTRMRLILTTARFQQSLSSAHNLAVVDIAASPAPRAETSPPSGARPGSNDPCVVVFTSGTTGAPNGVVVTHGNIANLLLSNPGNLGMRPGAVVAQVLNIAFDMAVWETLGALANGATLAIRGADIGATVRTANIVIATPSILARLDVADARSVETVAVAGERCPRALADAWASVATFYNSCGPTEVTIVNTMHRHVAGAEEPPIGLPVPNTTVYVLDEQGAPVAAGDVGEMWVGGAGVTAGYLDEPALTAARYRLDPFAADGSLMFGTRDLTRWNADGNLEHLGRIDDQVKVRGFRVELSAVSVALEAEVSVAHAAVVCADDRTSLIGFVAPASADIAAAAAAVRKALPYYCVPTEIHAVDELPTTNRGKVDQRSLKDIAIAARNRQDAA